MIQLLTLLSANIFVCCNCQWITLRSKDDAQEDIVNGIKRVFNYVCVYQSEEIIKLFKNFSADD